MKRKVILFVETVQADSDEDFNELLREVEKAIGSLEIHSIKSGVLYVDGIARIEDCPRVTSTFQDGGWGE